MPEPTPAVSRLFLVVTFTAAIAIGAAIIYFGINGYIGGSIP
jgi:hypothetical protein